jgi:chromosome segregation ATPase
MMPSNKDDRWEKLKAGLYDAIYGKGLEQPYLDSTARLLDELRRDYAGLKRELAQARDNWERALDKIADLEAKLSERESFLRQCEQLCQGERYMIVIAESGIPEAPYLVKPSAQLSGGEARIMDLEAELAAAERERAAAISGAESYQASALKFERERDEARGRLEQIATLSHYKMPGKVELNMAEVHRLATRPARDEKPWLDEKLEDPEFRKGFIKEMSQQYTDEIANLQRENEELKANLQTEQIDNEAEVSIMHDEYDELERANERLREHHGKLLDAAHHAVSVLGLEDSIERLKAVLEGDDEHIHPVPCSHWEDER